MTNKERFLKLTSADSSNTLERAKQRQREGKYLHLSKKIAIKILASLDLLGWTQVDLAKQMGVTPQQINKWVKGNENFTLETLVNLSEVLGVELIQLAMIKDKSTYGEREISVRFTYSKNVVLHEQPLSSQYVPLKEDCTCEHVV